MTEQQKTKTWEETRIAAATTRSGRVIGVEELPSITGIPEALAAKVRSGTHNLIIDMTGRPTLQARWN